MDKFLALAPWILFGLILLILLGNGLSSRERIGGAGREEQRYSNDNYPDPHDHQNPRQFAFNEDENVRDWDHIPGTGEPEPGAISLFDAKTRDGKGLTRQEVTNSHRVTGRDQAEIIGRMGR